MAEKKGGLIDSFKAAGRRLIGGMKAIGKGFVDTIGGAFHNLGDMLSKNEGIIGTLYNTAATVYWDVVNGADMLKYKRMISKALNVLINIAEKMMGILHQETEAATKAAEAAGKESPTKGVEKAVGSAGKDIKEKAEQVTDKVKANVKDAPGKEVKGMSGKEAIEDAAKDAAKTPGDAAKAAVKAPASAMKEAGSKGMAIVSGAAAAPGKALAPAASKGNIPTR